MLARRGFGTPVAIFLLFGLGACAGPPARTEPTVEADDSSTAAPPSRRGPFVRVLGTAQDGGLPHAACSCSRCETARRDPAARRLIASLAVVLPASGRVFLVDATPDIREQLDRLADVRGAPAGRVDRAPIDGVLLTHAHIGHYLGLAFFGFEAVHTRGLPVFATEKMAGFLRANGPWSQLVGLGNIDLRPVRPGEPFALGDGVQVTAIRSPHRDEYSDTVGFRFDGPRATLLYLPDTDSWEAWETPLDRLLDGVDVALLDGSFYSLAELPGRSVESIGHPLIADTMARLAERARSGTTRVLFTHLNHSNPALEAGGAESAAIDSAGFAVLADGSEIGL